MRILQEFLDVLFWTLTAAMLLGGALIILGWFTVPMFGFFGLVGALVLLPLIVRAAVIARRRRGRLVLGYIEHAVRLNLPLPRMLLAAQQGESGATALRLLNLTERLAGGSSIAIAVHACVPELDARSTAMIAAAEKSGQLPHALRRLVNPRPPAEIPDTSDAAFMQAYPFVMFIVVMWAVCLLNMYTLPKLRAIFHDFGTPLPPITQAAFGFSQAIAVGIFITAGGIALVCAGRSLMHIFVPVRYPLISATRDYFFWWMPFVHGVVLSSGLADALDLIARSLRDGVPAPQAVSQAARLRVNRILQHRLRVWAERLADGASLAEAARFAKLPPIIADMLAPATNGGGAAGAVDFLARYYTTRFSRAAILLQNAAIPVMVFIFGFFVAVIALSIVVPMTALIGHFS